MEKISEDQIGNWVLTIYNDSNEIEEQVDINYRTEYYAHKEAENIVDQYPEYDDEWDWSLMPEPFFVN